MPDYYKFSSGQEFGTHFIPTETDVSIRPGWYYHPEEDDKVKSLDKLIDIYFNSIGLNSSLLLNIPVDKRGLIHENDAQRMLELGKFLKNTFNKNLMEESELEFNNKSHPINKIIDKNINTFCAFKSSNNNIINITLENKKLVDVFEISENINLGQRIKEFIFEIKVNEKWVTIEKGTTIGKKRLIKFDPLIIKDLRFTIVDSKDVPLISEIGLYKSSQ